MKILVTSLQGEITKGDQAFLRCENGKEYWLWVENENGEPKLTLEERKS